MFSPPALSLFAELFPPLQTPRNVSFCKIFFQLFFYLLLVKFLSELNQPVAQLLLHLSQPSLFSLHQGLFSFFKICLVYIFYLLLFLPLPVLVCLTKAIPKLRHLLFQCLKILYCSSQEETSF